LFFFMIVTHMRPVPILAKFEVPNAKELQEMEDKSQLIYLMVGEKTDENGQPAIQLNSFFTTMENLPDNLRELKNELSVEDQRKMVVILKIDKNTEMGLVNDVKQILRETGLLTVYYSAEKES
jgi:Biopolymer transport protein